LNFRARLNNSQLPAKLRLAATFRATMKAPETVHQAAPGVIHHFSGREQIPAAYFNLTIEDGLYTSIQGV
jgi:hypothetical protein